MQRTLFFVPHEMAGLPIWGAGWALIAIFAAIAIYLITVRRRGHSVGDEIKANAVLWLMAIGVVVFILPQIELRGPAIAPDTVGRPIGLAIRGYGVMMLTGVVTAVGLAVYRGRSRGIPSDTIFGLAPWLLIFGIVGARLFYVIEYRRQFLAQNSSGRIDWGSTIGHIFDFTSGGLVVYGSILGGLVGALVYCQRHKLNALRLGDVVMPCLFLGIFFGRLGCLMNGCCYGGRCEDASWALHFPPGSPVYEEQLSSGELVGLRLEEPSSDRLLAKKGAEEERANDRERVISQVIPGSLAERAGMEAGQTVEWIRLQRPPLDQLDPSRPAEDTRALGVAMEIAGKPYYWPAAQLPPRARPVWPAQIISSLSALLICLSLLAVSPFLRRDGMLVVLGFAGYAVVRFGLEMVRSDEPGQFGTGLTISQLVSIGTFGGAMILLFVILRQRPRNLPSSGTGQPA